MSDASASVAPLGLVPVAVLGYLVPMTAILPLLMIDADELWLVPVHAAGAAILYAVLLRAIGGAGSLDGIAVAQGIGLTAGAAAASVFLLSSWWLAGITFLAVGLVAGLVARRFLVGPLDDARSDDR